MRTEITHAINSRVRAIKHAVSRWPATFEAWRVPKGRPTVTVTFERWHEMSTFTGEPQCVSIDWERPDDFMHNPLGQPRYREVTVTLREYL